MKEKESAMKMLDIMISRIKSAQTDEEMLIRQYRACGAIFILYFLDIITYEEQRTFEDRIFKT